MVKSPKGIKLYNRAKTIIPGGTQLLSKRPEMFLPDQWPSYYKKCKGSRVWDLDGNVFWDVGISGVSSCVLGYADPDVNRAVRQAVSAGSMCTLNCPEEVELAELLCTLHPWAEMVRFGRCGGEAMAMAVRIARAATGREKIVFCGYHGWHDWYLSANLADDKNLNGQLLPGLEPAGVVQGLTGTALPFRYNCPDELDKIVRQHQSTIAAIVMEPVRDRQPDPGFLAAVRKAADKIGAVLIFDEVTSGWRLAVGGAHLNYGINPDMAVFAKAMGNGYPMAAVIGKAAVMKEAQKSFISSTYWTERIGPSAALAAIRKMRRVNLPAYLSDIGALVRRQWEKAAAAHQLNIQISGLTPISAFSFAHGDASLAMHTLFNQEMMQKHYLASKAFSVTYAHTPKLIEQYGEAVDQTFALISRYHKAGTLEKHLKGPLMHTGFKRLT